MGIEDRFDVGFIAKLTAEEKQIQQRYRPVVGVHKWFARRPGALLRGLLISEFGGSESLSTSYFRSHRFSKRTIADPFMGGGTTLFEANRLGLNTIGVDINPMAYWIVRQELLPIDIGQFRNEAAAVAGDVSLEVNDLYVTMCEECGRTSPVKYFLWVKEQECSSCARMTDLFPGYLIAERGRHPKFVLHCPLCVELVQVESLPEAGEKVRCPRSNHEFDWSRGSAFKNTFRCQCGHSGRYPSGTRESGPPRHRLFGMEYSCTPCTASHRGRWFKTPDREDLARFRRAERRLKVAALPHAVGPIPDGDETRRLHRWGYQKYHEMFNARQLLSLGHLASRIARVKGQEERHALATVFSDIVRYQNMLCRYDTAALKCQDIFSVHGFPVGLIQCENNVLGIPGIGGGGFNHFVEKYATAKEYCAAPFETVKPERGPKRIVPISGERISADLVESVNSMTGDRQAYLGVHSYDKLSIKPGSLDGVFTDPPYFNNVQYAELMDFCYAWLRPILREELGQFSRTSTRHPEELTGNQTQGKGLDHFTQGLSRIFTAAAKGLKPDAPFVFTYHHNDPEAYVPVIVAILDSGLRCAATLPCPSEMKASLHIKGTRSSVMDSIFVCRNRSRSKGEVRGGRKELKTWLKRDRDLLMAGGVRMSTGDLYCLGLGHLARVTMDTLTDGWESQAPIEKKIRAASAALAKLIDQCGVNELHAELLASTGKEKLLGRAPELLQSRMFNEQLHRG